MNKKDEKILIELIKNSRIPLTQLSKKVGLSREVTNYRINRLVKKGIIKKFYTEINESFLGFERFGCAIKLKNVSEEQEQEIIKTFSNNKYVTYFGTIIGKWNFAFDILVKNKQDLEKNLVEMFAKYEQKIKEYVLYVVPSESGFFPAKIFNSNFEEKEKEKEKIKLTKIDFRILELLSNNSRIEYSELSKKLNLGAKAIKSRLKNLEKFGVINYYTLSLNYKKLGFDFYNLQLKFTDKNFSLLKSFLRRNKRVKYYYKHLGNPNWNIDVGLLVQSSKELREFLIELKNLFGDYTEINDIYLLPETIKDNILPEGVFGNNTC